MTIKIQSHEPLINVSYKVPSKLKEQIEKISEKEGVAQGEIVRAFLEFAKDAYNEGKVQRLWGEQMMKHFRSQIIVGDKILASGIVGYVRKIIEADGKRMPRLFHVEIAKGVLIWLCEDVVSDVLPQDDLNVRKELYQEMKKFQKKLKPLRVKKSKF